MVHLRLSWATEYIEASLGCIASSRMFWTAVEILPEFMPVAPSDKDGDKGCDVIYQTPKDWVG